MQVGIGFSSNVLTKDEFQKLNDENDDLIIPFTEEARFESYEWSTIVLEELEGGDDLMECGKLFDLSAMYERFKDVSFEDAKKILKDCGLDKYTNELKLVVYTDAY